jgi:hypothetical protein
MPAMALITSEKRIWRELFQEKKIYFIKNSNLLVSKLQEKPSLKREHPALQKMKFINVFLCLCVTFALLDSDPDCDNDKTFIHRSPEAVCLTVQER